MSYAAVTWQRHGFLPLRRDCDLPVLDPCSGVSPSCPPHRILRVSVPGFTGQSARGPLNSPQLITSWVCRLLAAAIMIETLYFKFTGAPESVYIFSKMNLEPWWRYGQGIWELLASLFLLPSRTAWQGPRRPLVIGTVLR